MRIKSVFLTALILAVFTTGTSAQVLSGIANNGVNGNMFGRLSVNIKVAASFSGVRGAITGITVNLSKHGSPSGEVVVELRSGSYDGQVLIGATVGAGQIPSGSYSDFSVSFPRVELSSAVTYNVVFSKTGSPDDANYFIVGSGNQGSAFGEVSSASWAWLNSNGWTGHRILGAPKISFTVLPSSAPSPAPIIAVSPLSLTMDSTVVGNTSAKVFSVSNTGTADLIVGRVSVTGADASQFPVSPTTATISPSASRAFTVSFSPTSAGSKSATVSISHNAAGSPTIVSVSGVGNIITPPPVVPVFSISTVSLAIDSADVGGFSQKTFVVSNTGTAALSVTGIAVDGSDAGHFSVLPTTTAISTGGSQSFVVTFSPMSVGAKSATLSISYNASGSPSTVTLNGVGKPVPPPPAPIITVSPLSLTMDSTVVGNTSVKLFTIANTGNAALSVTGIAVSGADAEEFVVSQTTAVVSPGASQTVTVTFSPSSPGAKSATVAVSSNGSANPVNIALSGFAKPLVLPNPPVPVFNVSVSFLTMDSTIVGSTTQKMFVVSNADGGTLTISGISVVGSDASQFSVSPVTASLTAGDSQAIAVTFAPTSAGSKSATVSISHNAAGSPTSVAVSGVGKPVPPSPPTSVPGIIIFPSSLAMDSVVVGSVSQKNVVIRNDSLAALNIAIVSVSGSNGSDFGAFVSGTTVGGSGGVQTLTVSFTPSAIGVRQAQVRIDHNGVGGVSFVSVSGVGKVVVQPTTPGTGPMIRVEPSQLQMDAVAVGNISQKTLAVTNFGSAILSAGISASGGDSSNFSVFPRQISVAPGASESVLVSFSPSSDGYKRTNVVFKSNAANYPRLDVQVSGSTPPKPVVYVNPVVRLSASPIKGVAPLTVRLTNNNTGGSINWWEWKTGEYDQNPVMSLPVRIRRDANGDTLTYTFDKPGIYKPSLTVFGPGGGGDSQSLADSVVVLEPLPPKLLVGVKDDSLAMGEISADGKSEIVFAVRNPSSSAISGSIAIQGDSSFSVAPSVFSIAGGDSLSVSVKFQPSSVGVKNGKIVIRYDATGAMEEISVSGIGKEVKSAEISGGSLVTPKPVFVSSASSVELGKIEIGRGKSSVSFSVGNAGAAPLTGSLFFRGDGAFSVKPDSINILPGKIDSVVVYFAPTNVGSADGRIYIFHNGSDDVEVIIVNGEGISPSAPNLIGDFNSDGKVYFEDMFSLSDEMLKPAEFQDVKIYDITGDGKVDTSDFFLFADYFGNGVTK